METLKKASVNFSRFLQGLLVSMVILLLMLLSSTTTSSQNNKSADKSKVHWISLEQALDLSKKEPRKIFMDVYTPWCGWCRVMDTRTFGKKRIADFMNSHFYCVKFNAEGNDTVLYKGNKLMNTPPVNDRNSTHALAFSLLDGHLAYPSLVFLDASGNRIYVMQSFMKPTDFEKYMKFIMDDSYQHKVFGEE